ncbi:sugar ABC transporter substrate-binding protein [Tessaracoccus oleiagri]|uniref:Ribose transport system substrate-binding protein n=1 Tax=Tessaracoccus oleiagri TaxID=686624 RepID=A0A1G9I6S7_9ACTN|nr:sugar ABC transporter substrate-binding protein [Tessaracoccus oleiagri]SDL20931.1 ribose transport system substrate-binding protein [Tessaracoccus oleiagri]
MKKTLIAAVSVVSLALSACSMGASEPGAGNTGGSAAGGDDDIKVGVILKTLSSEYWSYVAAGVEAASEELGVDVQLQGAASETAYDEQNNMIETMLADNSLDALVIAPLQPDSVVSVLGDTEKPILFVDTDAPYDAKVSYIGTGNKVAAQSGGEAAAELAGEGATAAWIGGVQGNTTSDEREAGFIEGLKSGGVEVTVKQYADGLADKASSVMENVLTSNPDLKVVVANNDEMAAGAARAAEAAGKDLVIFGFDGIQAGVQNVIDGTVAGTVAQDPYGMGYKAVEAAIAAAKGETVEEFIDTGSTVITQENAEEYLATLREQLGEG